jgi:hypothetical protein
MIYYTMLEWFYEISDLQAELIKSFAIFYLLLVGSYMGNIFLDNSLFTCFQTKIIKEHKWIQIVVIFFVFYFLVTLVSTTGNLEYIPPIEKLLYSIVYFIAFLSIMRLDTRITFIVLLLIFITYFLELNKDFYLERGLAIVNPEDKETYNNNQYWITLNWPFKIRLFPVVKDDFIMINKVETLIYYVIIILLILGFIAYGGEVKDTLLKSKNLSWFDVITDIKICNVKDRKSFLEYVRLGLGLKL